RNSRGFSRVFGHAVRLRHLTAWAKSREAGAQCLSFGRRLRAAYGARPPRLLVAVDALSALVTLLRFDRQGRDGSRLEALDRDWLAGLFAVAVCAVLDAR